MKTESQIEYTLVIIVKRNTIPLSKNRQLCQKIDKWASRLTPPML